MSEKKMYYVTMPFAGQLTVAVEAEDEEAAKEAMWEETGRVAIEFYERDPETRQRRESPNVMLDEWEVLEKLAEGNFLYACCNEMEITEEDPS